MLLVGRKDWKGVRDWVEGIGLAGGMGGWREAGVSEWLTPPPLELADSK